MKFKFDKYRTPLAPRLDRYQPTQSNPSGVRSHSMGKSLSLCAYKLFEPPRERAEVEGDGFNQPAPQIRE